MSSYPVYSSAPVNSSRIALYVRSSEHPDIFINKITGRKIVRLEGGGIKNSGGVIFDNLAHYVHMQNFFHGLPLNKKITLPGKGFTASLPGVWEILTLMAIAVIITISITLLVLL